MWSAVKSNLYFYVVVMVILSSFSISCAEVSWHDFSAADHSSCYLVSQYAEKISRVPQIHCKVAFASDDLNMLIVDPPSPPLSAPFP